MAPAAIKVGRGAAKRKLKRMIDIDDPSRTKVLSVPAGDAPAAAAVRPIQAPPRLRKSSSTLREGGSASSILPSSPLATSLPDLQTPSTPTVPDIKEEPKEESPKVEEAVVPAVVDEPAAPSPTVTVAPAVSVEVDNVEGPVPPSPIPEEKSLLDGISRGISKLRDGTHISFVFCLLTAFDRR